MLCPNCGTENPEANRFCGSCGRSLLVGRIPRENDAPEPKPTPREETHIAGPSILGIGGPASDGNDVSYLLEDEPRRSSAGFLFLILIFVLLLAFVAYKRGYIQAPNWFRQHEVQKPGVPAVPATADNKITESTPAPNPSASDTSEQSVPMTQSDRPASPPPASSTPANATAAKENPEPQPTKTKIAESAPPKPSEPAAAEDDSADDTVPAQPATARAKAAKSTPERAKAPFSHSQQPDERLLLTGENYLYGRGVPKSCDQAVVYLTAAAKARNAKAMSHLGAMYATGECVPLDRPTAYRWLSMAREADPANPWLQQNRLMLWRQMSASEQNRVARIQ